MLKDNAICLNNKYTVGIFLALIVALVAAIPTAATFGQRIGVVEVQGAQHEFRLDQIETNAATFSAVQKDVQRRLDRIENKLDVLIERK